MAARRVGSLLLRRALGLECQLQQTKQLSERALPGPVVSAFSRGCTTEASTSGQQTPAPGWLGREIKAGKPKDPPLSWLYMREGPDGTKKLMPLYERLIWGTVLGGISYFVGSRVYTSRLRAAEEAEAERVREAELQERRLLAARVVLSGRSWVADEEDPFDGMSPKQIVEFIKKHNIDPSDPFEGLSPEEIDALAKKMGLTEL